MSDNLKNYIRPTMGARGRTKQVTHVKFGPTAPRTETDVEWAAESAFRLAAGAQWGPRPKPYGYISKQVGFGRKGSDDVTRFAVSIRLRKHPLQIMEVRDQGTRCLRVRPPKFLEVDDKACIIFFSRAV